MEVTIALMIQAQMSVKLKTETYSQIVCSQTVQTLTTQTVIHLLLTHVLEEIVVNHQKLSV